MKITREFCPGDRYIYDFGLCTYEKGWAQVDTAQDASYFGTWANPTRLMIFSYCKGDTTLKEAASPEEFVAELRESTIGTGETAVAQRASIRGSIWQRKRRSTDWVWPTCCTE